MPLLFLFERSEAQGNVKVPTDTSIAPLAKQPEIMGKLIYQPAKEITVSGKVVDEENEPVPFATIAQKGTNKGVAADSEGNFSIKINVDDSTIVLQVSCVSFMPTEKLVFLNNGDQTIEICLAEHRAFLGDVEVTSTVNYLTGTTGGISVCRKITTVEKIDSAVRKVFNISVFKIYPNPVIKGSAVYLEIPRLPAGTKLPGEYQLQLLDNQSRLIKVEEINTTSEKSAVAVQIPSGITAGIYYLRLIDEKNKKQYTEKLIIQ